MKNTIGFIESDRVKPRNILSDNICMYACFIIIIIEFMHEFRVYSPFAIATKNIRMEMDSQIPSTKFAFAWMKIYVHIPFCVFIQSFFFLCDPSFIHSIPGLPFRRSNTKDAPNVISVTNDKQCEAMSLCGCADVWMYIQFNKFACI